MTNNSSKHDAKRAEIKEKRDEIKGKVHDRKEAFEQRSQEETSVRGHKMTRGDIFKFAGLIAFVVILGLVAALLWPYMHQLFEPGGVETVMNDVRDAGPLGVLILLAMQFLQIVVAFIPGEVVQMAAGMIYGPWVGGLVILVGCILSSAFIFAVVHRLGAPFVHDMVPAKYLDKFNAFEENGKLDIIVFILFLIPAMPKDVFTYLVPLTNMPMRKFLVLSNVGRIPGIIVSTYAAAGLVDGRLTQSLIIFGVVAVIALVCVVFRERIMGFLHDRHGSKKSDK